MNKVMSLVVLGSALAFGSAYAQTKPAASAPAAKPAASAAAAPAAKPAASAPAAAASAAPMGKQQAKMTDCNAEAKEKNLKGDERKKFMSTCLKGASDAQKAQQAKMKTCNKEAGDKKLKGDERKKFMSTCLSA